MKPPANPHYRHRFPAEIISHAVCLYHVLSLQDVVTKALAVPVRSARLDATAARWSG